MISAVLIDDEQESINDLLYLFEKQKLPVKVVATANSAKDGLVAILKNKPELVFLDIVMPDMSGFDMLTLLPNIHFHLVVTTSNDKFAVQALRSSAIDFLLKPVKASELKDAVNRCSNSSASPSKKQIHLLNENLNEPKRNIQKIALSVSDGVQLVSLDDILYFESEGNYTTVFYKNGKSTVVSKQIGQFEEMVDKNRFFRLHHSFLVNMLYVSKFVRSDGGYVVLENGKTLNVSRAKKDAFLEALSRL